MTVVQRVAQVFGVVFILVAILGFIASGSSMESDPSMAPMLLGMIPVNVLHNVVHLAFGVWGLLASRTFAGARSYGIIAGILYLVLAICGYFIPDTFGLIPIGGNAIWLHALLGVILAAAGFSAKAAPVATT